MIKPCKKCGAMDRYKSGKCKPCRKLAAANWWKTNPEKKKLAGANWYKANSEKVKISAANWIKTNPEKKKLTNAAWSRANPDTRRIHKQNRRARKRANGGKLSTNLTEILYAKQKGKCVCCKEPLSKNYHLDHIMPLALGGKNEDWNMQLLRSTCNLQKHSKHPIEYMQSKGLLL